MGSIKLEGFAAAFFAAAVVLTIAAVIALGIVGRSIDAGCVAECLERNALAMQTHTAIAAWASVIVTLATGVLVLRTLHYARKSAEAAVDAVATSERIGKSQVRAYLAIDGAAIALGQLGSIDFNTELKNTGQSPATKIRAHLKIGLYWVGTDPEGEVFEEEKWVAQQTVPVPHISAAQAFPLRFSVLALFNNPPIPKLFESDEYVAVRATLSVTYVDVFDDQQAITESFSRLVESYDRLKELTLSRR